MCDTEDWSNDTENSSLLQHHNSKASILLRSVFFTVQFSHPHIDK
uniref:Uncharacterized protein n=1 Tax=Cyprinus carpio carpio TaxID=630221 RepID=A0A9J7Z6K5_CYPCA